MKTKKSWFPYPNLFHYPIYFVVPEKLPCIWEMTEDELQVSFQDLGIPSGDLGVLSEAEFSNVLNKRLNMHKASLLTQHIFLSLNNTTKLMAQQRGAGIYAYQPEGISPNGVKYTVPNNFPYSTFYVEITSKLINSRAEKVSVISPEFLKFLQNNYFERYQAMQAKRGTNFKPKNLEATEILSLMGFSNWTFTNTPKKIIGEYQKQDPKHKLPINQEKQFPYFDLQICVNVWQHDEPNNGYVQSKNITYGFWQDYEKFLETLAHWILTDIVHYRNKRYVVPIEISPQSVLELIMQLVTKTRPQGDFAQEYIEVDTSPSTTAPTSAGSSVETTRVGSSGLSNASACSSQASEFPVRVPKLTELIPINTQISNKRATPSPKWRWKEGFKKIPILGWLFN